MTSSELRSEISKVIGQLPDSVLSDLSTLVKRLQVECIKNEERENLIRKIFEEDRELFRMLAQYDSEL